MYSLAIWRYPYWRLYAVIASVKSSCPPLPFKFICSPSDEPRYAVVWLMSIIRSSDMSCGHTGDIFVSV